MRAALLKEFGRPLSVEEMDDPVPGPGQVLVRVQACGVCHTDVHIADGEWERFKKVMPVPVVLGHEVAGEVAALGPGVDRLKEGSRVGIPWFHRTCDTCAYCRNDLEVYCEKSQITGVTVNGGFGEYAVAWQTHAVPIPDELSFIEAAPLFCAGATVYSALKKVTLDGSTHLAVWGAGGLGRLAIQVAKISGARVTAVDTLPAKLEASLEVGADQVILSQEAREHFADFADRPDIALVCAPSIQAYQGALPTLKMNGTLLVVGLPSEEFGWTPADLVRSGVRVIPSRVSSRQEIRELLALAARHGLDSGIECFGIDDVNDVLRRLKLGEIRGRAVIDFGTRS